MEEDMKRLSPTMLVTLEEALSIGAFSHADLVQHVDSGSLRAYKVDRILKFAIDDLVTLPAILT